MDRLRSMRAFVLVADEQSFVAAARTLQVAPAAVSRLVADLEAHLGVRLLQRSTRRVALTSVGEQYLTRTRSILADIDETEALTSTLSAKPVGRLRVRVPPAFSSHQIAKHLPRFHAQYPEIAVDMSSAPMLDAVDEAYDVSILISRMELQQGDFIARRLAITHMILCASPAYLLRHGTPEVPGDLAQHQSLIVNSSGQPPVWILRRPCVVGDDELVEQHPPSILSSEHADTLFGAALAGLGIAALPSYIVDDALTRGELTRVLSDWSLSTLTVYAAIPTRKHLPARTRAFMEFLVSTFGSDGDPWLRADRQSTGHTRR